MKMVNNVAKRWVSIKDIVLHLEVNKDTIHKWIRNESILCYRIDKRWKLKDNEVNQSVKDGESINKE